MIGIYIGEQPFSLMLVITKKCTICGRHATCQLFWSLHQRGFTEIRIRISKKNPGNCQNLKQPQHMHKKTDWHPPVSCSRSKSCPHSVGTPCASDAHRQGSHSHTVDEQNAYTDGLVSVLPYCFVYCRMHKMTQIIHTYTHICTHICTHTHTNNTHICPHTCTNNTHTYTHIRTNTTHTHTHIKKHTHRAGLVSILLY